MIADTSRVSYERIYKSLGDRQQQVYDAIGELGVATGETVADHLGWTINRVTGRITELHKYGLVGVEGMGMNKSGHVAKLWAIRDINDKKLQELDCND